MLPRFIWFSAGGDIVESPLEIIFMKESQSVSTLLVDSPQGLLQDVDVSTDSAKTRKVEFYSNEKRQHANDQ